VIRFVENIFEANLDVTWQESYTYIKSIKKLDFKHKGYKEGVLGEKNEELEMQTFKSLKHKR